MERPATWPAQQEPTADEPHEEAAQQSMQDPTRGAAFTPVQGSGDDQSTDRPEIIARLAELQRGLGRFFARDRSMPIMASNLTMQQLKVVVLLSYQGSTSGQELARHLGVGLGTVTGIVDRVVAQGLATRREDPNDRRIRRVELTEAGRRLTTEMLDAGAAGYRRLLERLDTGTLRTMETVMGKIHEAMRQMEAEDHAGDHQAP
ncbi:MarR family transcriptional regulator [Planotetraspora sp. A-T 1434]|uniref:MarR family winged helix-turn-helix transcriptional regulator n=1 Tax=Planotetraspora sp. A-T 1434 TaxID=2979219 RepID=UPI0021C1A3F6|nr:MarR family transcriptional regulator [Planotetraspora sp. A-T 1434]MCT9933091.1 MarR family transcriptional regulator [Planotetraspora sp. A-T 1434]